VLAPSRWQHPPGAEAALRTKLPFEFAPSGWLRLTVLAPSRCWHRSGADAVLRAKVYFQKRSMLVRHRFGQVDHRKQHKDVCLNQSHKEVQAHKDDWDSEWYQ
jgi:hypothetical protein